MPVAEQSSVSTFTGNGVTTVYAFAWGAGAASHVKVDVNGVSKAQGVDFTVSVGAASGTVTFVTAPASGATVLIYRDTPLTRTTDYQDSGPWRAAVVDEDMDSLWRAMQDRDALVDRAMRAPLRDSASLSMSLPVAASRASKLLGFDASGQPVATTATVAQIDAAIASYIAAPGSTAAGVTFTPAGTGSVGRTVQAKLRDVISSADFGPVGDDSVDDTDALQAALDAAAGKTLVIEPGTYKITDELTLSSDSHVVMSPGVTIRQATADKGILYGFQKTDIVLECNRATLEGEGTWSAGWTGNSGHDDHGIRLTDCSRFSIIRPHILNCGHAGIALIGSRYGSIAHPIIEGTHVHGQALPSQANFQQGIWLRHDATYGACDGIVILGADISGVAQGVLSELWSVGAAPTSGIAIIAPRIHDIPGQHAFYLQTGYTSIVAPIMTDIELAGVKVQSASDANQTIRNVSVTGALARGVGSNLFEIATLGTGSIENLKLDAVGYDIGTGIAIVGKVLRAAIDLRLSTVEASAVVMQGADQRDIEIDVDARSCGDDGVIITSTTSQDIRIRPRLRECNTANGASESGIRVVSASAQVDIYDPDVTDADGKMLYGLFNATAGSVVRVFGSARFTGAADTAVRATGVISEFPSGATLSGANGACTSWANVSSSQPITVAGQSTSASNAVLWQQAMPDESAFMVTADIVGKLSGSAERKAVRVTGLFYRDGGICTLQGSVDEDVSVASGSFAGVYSLQSNGANDVVLQVNSGGSATYDWSARVAVVKVA